ncbi:MAG: hypothetical protein JNK67_28565 [Alphaproteobacteria bacterium]|nr:hypothetical protein [Alphaproteobacteria bacterium]
MARFTVNAPVETDQPTIAVDQDPAAPLVVGRHRFRLEVVDDSGNRSLPDEVVVIVADTERPTAVLRAPASVSAGRAFTLDGSRSFDVGGGKVKQYVFTYLGPAT